MRIDLDLDAGSEPVAGRLVVAGGAEHPFTGYAGLIAALEELRRGEDGGSSPNHAAGEVAP